MSSWRNEINDPTYPFKYVDLKKEPITETDRIIRRVIECNKLVNQGYCFRDVVNKAKWPIQEARYIFKIRDMRTCLLQAYEVGLITLELARLLQKMSLFCREEYIEELVDQLGNKKLTAAQMEEEAGILLDHYQRCRKGGTHG